MITGTFLIILCGLVISKMTVLLAATNTRINMSIYCTTYLQPGSNNLTYKQCVTTSYYYNVTGNESCLQPRHSNPDIPIGSVTEYDICESVSVRWIWCLTLILITPEFFIFLRCFWSICFKKETTPSVLMFLTVSTV